MGASKSDSFSEEHNKIATMLKAMAHPARVAIIEYLLNFKGCICSDIVNELPLSQPTVSQHLRELKSAGIIQGEIQGKAICYCINRTAINAMREYFGNMDNTLQEAETNCC